MRSFSSVFPILALALSSCSSIKVGGQYDQTVRFDTLKTYAWAPGEQTGLSDPRLNAAAIDPQIRSAVNSELATKGYKKTEVANADFLISYHVAMEDESRYQAIDNEAPYAGFSVVITEGDVYRGLYQDPMTVTRMDVYRVGTLQLGIRDPKTKKVIWHSVAQARLLETASPDQRKQRLKEAIHKMLDRFPPK